MATACSRVGRIAAVCALAVLCSSCGPRMRQQKAIQPYERQMPAMPAGTVPTTGRLQSNAAGQARWGPGTPPSPPLIRGEGRGAPLLAKEGLGEVGRIYYGYYCRMCHGAKGDGNGPVGESYVPKPADLTSRAVKRLTDGQLCARMLHGVGHDPVMVQTVPAGRRWQIVSYVRSLGR